MIEYFIIIEWFELYRVANNSTNIRDLTYLEAESYYFADTRICGSIRKWNSKSITLIVNNNLIRDELGWINVKNGFLKVE